MRWGLPKDDCSKWTPWFAWYPVELVSGGNVWLEHIFRRKSTESWPPPPVGYPPDSECCIGASWQYLLNEEDTKEIWIT